MSICRQCSLAVFALTTLACRTELGPPSNAVVGRFGGRGVELVATASKVRVQFLCSFVEYQRPLIPAVDDAFTLPPTLVRSATGNAAVALRGKMNVDGLVFEAIWLWPTGNTGVQQYAVQRDRAPDFSGMACAATRET